MTILELSLVGLLGIYNTPYPNKKTLIPEMRLEEQFTKWSYVDILSSARCNPDSVILWGPLTARWGVEGGIKIPQANIRFGVGHISEHGIDKVVRQTESFDYWKISLHQEFP